MIGVLFHFGGETIEVRVDGTTVLFRSAQTQGMFGPIDALKLSYSGVIKEHPDLIDDKEWRAKTIQRFKAKIKSYTTETQRMEYLIDDLGKFGYVATYYQKQGHRPIKLTT